MNKLFQANVFFNFGPVYSVPNLNSFLIGYFFDRISCKIDTLGSNNLSKLCFFSLHNY